jgi:membrane-associated phospholipid phosphatase
MHTTDTPKPSYWKKYYPYVIAFGLSIALFLGCAWLAHYRVLTGWEYSWLEFANRLPDRVYPIVGSLIVLGSFWVAAVCVVVAFVLRLYQLAWRLALSIFTVYGLVLLARELIERPSPAMLTPELHLRIMEPGFAFPSLHVAIATVLALTIFRYLPYVWRWAVLVVWIGSVMAGVFYLGLHAPLGIFAGLALGVGVVSFWRILPKPLKKMLHLK